MGTRPSAHGLVLTSTEVLSERAERTALQRIPDLSLEDLSTRNIRHCPMKHGFQLLKFLVLLCCWGGGRELSAADSNQQEVLAQGIDVRRGAAELTTLRKYPKLCENPAGCVPVIFIHGINGTQENPGPGNCGLEPCGLASAVVPDCNWGPLFKYLASQAQTKAMWGEMDVYVFRYISNQGLSVSDFAAQLKVSIQAAGITAPPVLVGHSMGGLVARELMETMMGPCPESAQCRYPNAITGAITLGTPHHGSPMANKRYRNWLAYRNAGSLFPAETPQESLRKCGLEELTEAYVNAQTGPLGVLNLVSKAIRGLSGMDGLFDPGAKDVCLFELVDMFVWGSEGRNLHAAYDPLTLNRRDLLWDEYDDLFQEPILELEKTTPEWNQQLRKSMQSQSASRMFVYGGSVIPPTGGWETNLIPLAVEAFTGSDPSLDIKLKLLAAMMETKLGLPIPSDGVVPLNSSLFLQNQNLAGRRNLLVPDGLEFDHYAMKGKAACPDPDSKTGILFNYIARDLQGLISFGGPAPETLTAQVLPSEASPGSTVALSIRGRNLRSGTMQLAVRVAQGATQLRCMELPLTFFDSGAGLSDLSATVPIPGEAIPGALQIQYEFWPATARGICTAIRPIYALNTKGTLELNIKAAAAVTTPPKVSLTTEPAGRTEFRLGERITLTLKTDAPVFADSGSSLMSAYLFLYYDGPSGRKFIWADSQQRLSESIDPRPAMAPLVVTSKAFPIAVGSVGMGTDTGRYTWHASLMKTEQFGSANSLAESAALSYTALTDRPKDPAVIAVGASQSKYLAGDQMVIRYTTQRGSSVAGFALMFRLTSLASGKDYYFYDDATDSNRWIHATARPFRSGAPVDGEFLIPAAGEPSILIENNAPTGTYNMLMYFSVPGTNLPVGQVATNVFRLETPTPEGSCFVATAAFGSPLASAVNLLRLFRDSELQTRGWGRAFVTWYYENGPQVARWLGPRPIARKVVRLLLWPVTAVAWLWMRLGALLALLTTVLLIVGAFLGSRRNRLARVALGLCTLLGIGFAGEIQGVVVRSKPLPSPVAGVAVRIEAAGKSTLTASDGTFKLTGLAAGEHKIAARTPTFLPGETSVTLPAATSRAVVTILLTPIAEKAYDYFVPHTAESDGWWSLVALANPNYTTAEFRVDAYAATGEYLGSSAELTSLGVNAQWSGSPSKLFGQSVIAKTAWYKVSSSGPLAGFLMFGQQSGTMAGFSLAEPWEGDLLFPHTAEDRQWWTGLGLVSAGTSSSTFRVEARAAKGGVLAVAPRPVVLSPGEKVVGTLKDLFGEDYPSSTQWLKVKSNSPLTGFELFGTRDFKMLAAIPALGRGSKRAYFPMLGTTGGLWTGIAILNVSTRTGNALMHAYSEEGAEVGVSRPFTLISGEKSVGVVESYFDRWPATARYVVLECDTELHSFELMGSSNPPLLGGLPMLEPKQRGIAFPNVQSDDKWDTTLSLVSTALAPANITLRAYDSLGQLVRETVVKVGARGFKSGTVKQLFGSAASGARWVKATSDQGMLIGYLRMERADTKQFTCIPAEPVVPAESVGKPSNDQYYDRLRTMGRAVESGRIKLSTVTGGVQVHWPAEWNPVVQLVVGRAVSPGIVVRAVAGTRVRTREDLLRCIANTDQAKSVEIEFADGATVRIDSGRRSLAMEAMQRILTKK